MALKPEASIMTSLAVGAVVYGIHANATPTNADTRSLAPGNRDIQRSERTATWMSAGVVAAISLLAKDPTIFVLGGAMTIAMAWWTRHSDLVDHTADRARDAMSPIVGDIGTTPSGVSEQPKMATVTPMFGPVI